MSKLDHKLIELVPEWMMGVDFSPKPKKLWLLKLEVIAFIFIGIVTLPFRLLAELLIKCLR
jgi:hypothetical protein